ncbi:MAG: hypothetical protein HY043_04550 [Verrucomicrobia bacterium]|nr:hypothetical protein [Verrucomicrobiota bacterium]
MNSIKEVSLPEFDGADQECPAISTEEYRSRIHAAAARLVQTDLEFLVIYGDREHLANLAYLTGMDPRFEEALLLLNRSGETLLLVGNECLGYLPQTDVGCRVELFQDFSLLGQPRNSSRPLKRILSDFGLGTGTRIGCVGWKYYEHGLVEGNEYASDMPAYLMDALRELAGDRRLVRNATAMFVNPEDGLRSVNSVDQIALMEHAAIHTSLAIRKSVKQLAPGVRECDLALTGTASGLPFSCHAMASFGEKVRRGLSTPSHRRAQLGAPFSLAQGLWGALSCRAGMVAASERDLTPELAAFYPRFAGNYFDVVVAWYERMKIGTSGGEIHAAAHVVRDPELMEFAVNPGHLIHLDEWLHSPFQADNTCLLRSGMAIQMDIIPVSQGPFCYVNAEDGIVLADETLRSELARRHPACWLRMQARRSFMSGALGIALDPSVLPLNNTPGWLCPYALEPSRVFVNGG